MSVTETVIRCAAEAYGVDAAEITEETDIREQLSNQSLILLVFISALEEELGVTVDVGEAGKLLTIRDFVNKVNELLQ